MTDNYKVVSRDLQPVEYPKELFALKRWPVLATTTIPGLLREDELWKLM